MQYHSASHRGDQTNLLFYKIITDKGLARKKKKKCEKHFCALGTGPMVLSRKSANVLMFIKTNRAYNIIIIYSIVPTAKGAASNNQFINSQY